MAVRKNPDGSITVGILDEFAKDMNVPIKAKEEPAEKKPVAKKSAPRKPKK